MIVLTIALTRELLKDIYNYDFSCQDSIVIKYLFCSGCENISQGIAWTRGSEP